MTQRDGNTISGSLAAELDAARAEITELKRSVEGYQRILAGLGDGGEHKHGESTSELALVESEQPCCEFFEREPNYCYRVSPDGIVLDVNPSALRALGYASRDELVGKPLLTTVYAPASRERARALFLRWRQTGELRDQEISIVTKTGEERIVVLNASAVRDEKGKLRYSMSIQTDITERKRAEEALHESESRYRLLFDAIPESVLVIGTDGRVAAANRASARLYGYESPEQLKGFYTPLLIAEKDRERATRLQAKLIQGEERPARQYTELRRDGTEFVAEVVSTPLHGPQQEVLGYIGITRDITAFVEAQAKLRESNEILLQFVRHSPIYAYIKAVTPTESRVLHASDSFREMVGLSGSEMVGKTMGELFPAEMAAKLTADDWSVVATGQVLGLDEELNGRSYETIKFPVLLGDRTCLAGYSADVTERRREQKASLDTSRRLQFALRAGHLGVWDWDITKNIMVWDDEMLALYGLTREQFPGGIEAWQQGLHHEDRERALVEYKAALGGSRDFNTEFRVIHPNGTVRYIKADGLVLRDGDGSPIRMLGVNRDITERKRAEDKLARSEGLLRQAQNIAQIGHFQFNPVTGVVEGSDELFRIFGLPREQFQFSNFASSVHPDDRVFVVSTIESAIEGKSGYEIEHRLLLGNGSLRWVRATGRFVIALPEGQSVLLGTVQDISESRQAEAEKAKLKAQLQQAQKMESVGRLAGGVAHDFNNMLGVILGHTELAMENVTPAEKSLNGSLEEIRKAAERSANLTRQLLAFARKQTVSPKVLDLNETVEGMLKMLRRLVGEDVNLVWLPGAGLCPVKVDPSQIDQILANLCVNARDAIGGVGKLTIATANSTLGDDDYATHPEIVPGEYVKLTVSDDGCGMDKATRERLFEPFFTTKEVGKGTGLGLATVYGIVKQNNGFITVTSEPDKGTTFEICLPRHVAASTGPAQSEPLTEPVARAHETILVVEDEPAILDMAKTMLERLGYTVLTASTPGEAIQLAGAHTGVIHLLMTDVVMPEMNGRDLAKNLLTSYPALKRLFMSGYTADVIAHHGVLDEGVNFIQKPFSKKDLAAKVSEALGRG